MGTKKIIEIEDQEEFLDLIINGIREDFRKMIKSQIAYQKRLFTYDEMSEDLGVCRNTLRKSVERGIVPIIRIGNSVRFEPEIVRQAFIKNSEYNVERLNQ